MYAFAISIKIKVNRKDRKHTFEDVNIGFDTFTFFFKTISTLELWSSKAKIKLYNIISSVLCTYYT